MIRPYFGLNRVLYLQTLCNLYGDFRVAWNYVGKDRILCFTPRMTVLELWHEDPSLLNRVQHRLAMPHEIFVEIDNEDVVAEYKKDICVNVCKKNGLEYAIYRSRKGYHISVLDKLNKIGKSNMIHLCNADEIFCSPNVTWSMEWTTHWKDNNFVLDCIYATRNYSYQLLRI